MRDAHVQRVGDAVHDGAVLAVVDHLVGLRVLVKVDDGVLAGDEVAVSVGGEVELVAGPDADGEGAEAHQAGQAAGVQGDEGGARLNLRSLKFKFKRQTIM